jgi:hypothetical protein
MRYAAVFLITFLLALSISAKLHAEEQHSVLDTLSSTTLTGYVDTSGIWRPSIPTSGAGDQLEIIAIIDGSDIIEISQSGAIWKHLAADLAASSLTINGISWQPSASPNLPNSGNTAFLTNPVNFAAAQLETIEARDTLVLHRSPTNIAISIADTLNGPGTYHFIVHFPSTPVLRIHATIDGSDELHISYAGARWIHKQWSSPTSVTLNDILWNPSITSFLTNSGPTLFLTQPVHFENAAVLSASGRDFFTVRSSPEGLIVNFADGDLGAGEYNLAISFPPPEWNPNAAIAATSSTAINFIAASGITIETLQGVWYELQSAPDLNSAWISKGSYIRGNGAAMTLFDPLPSASTQFYRVISRPSP